MTKSLGRSKSKQCHVYKVAFYHKTMAKKI